MVRFTAAQGDVFVRQIQEIQPYSNSVRTSGTNILVGIGESKDHAHVLVADDPIEILLDETINDGFTRRMIARIPASGATLTHPEHGPQAIPGGIDVEIHHGQVEYDPDTSVRHSID